MDKNGQRTRKSLCYPEPLVFFPLQEPHKRTFIILHGRGSNAQKLGPELLATPIVTKPAAASSPHLATASQPTPKVAEDESDPVTLRTAFPYAKFIFPTASVRRATIYKRAPIHQWFNNWILPKDPTAPGADENEDFQIEGLRETTLYLHGILRQEIAALDRGAHDVVLGGLSQGCAAALVALLMWEGERLGACFVMCGWLPFGETLRRVASGTSETDATQEDDDDDLFERGDDVEQHEELERAQRAIAHLREVLELPRDRPSLDLSTVQKTPILLCHGIKDEKVNVRLGRAAYQALITLGAEQVFWREYEGLGHWYSSEMLGDIASFLETQLAIKS